MLVNFDGGGVRFSRDAPDFLKDRHRRVVLFARLNSEPVGLHFPRHS
jgi:hypothetical protein